MTQALALQSLPEATLVAYLPPGTLIGNPNVNLNVASPLLQHRISALDKEAEVEKLGTSQDPGIKCWFEARKMRKAVQKIRPRVMNKHYQPSPKDAQGYREAFTNIWGDQIPEDVRGFLAACDLSGKYDDVAALTGFQALVQEDETLHPEDRYGLIPPQGTYSSRIAILLEEPSPVMAVETEPPLADDHRLDKYASYLGKKGLTLDKCLVFYTYYRQRLARLSDEERKQYEHAEHLRELTRHEELCDFLLDSIPAHIVLLCGEFQVSRVLDKHGISLRLVSLRFGSRELSAWLLVKGNQIRRMYIALPAFERVFYRGELAAIQKYEHGINVAAALTNTENVRVRFFEGAHVLGMVIKCLREQRNGSSYDTLDDLHSDIQYWLLRNGHLTEVDGRWVLKDMTRFNKYGKSLVEYIHYLITAKGARSTAMIMQQRALANARRVGR
jgi:hypothetical protein